MSKADWHACPPVQPNQRFGNAAELVEPLFAGQVGPAAKQFLLLGNSREVGSRKSDV
jgi:hypothetical protein